MDVADIGNEMGSHECLRLAPNHRSSTLPKPPSKREARTEAEWRAAFQPHAIIATDRSVPSPIFVAALIGVEKILRIDVNAGAKLHRFPEQNCINNADENGLEHGLFSWASGLGRIVGRRVGVVAA